MFNEAKDRLVSQSVFSELFGRKNLDGFKLGYEDGGFFRVKNKKFLNEKELKKLNNNEFYFIDFHKELLIFRFFLNSASLIVNIGVDPFFPNHVWSAGANVKVVSLIPFLSNYSKFDEMAKENEERFEYKVVSIGKNRDLHDHVYIVPVAGKDIWCSLALRADGFISDMCLKFVMKKCRELQVRKNRLQFRKVVSIGETVDNLMVNGISGFIWRRLEAIYFGFNSAAVSAILGATDTIRIHNPLVVLRKQIDADERLHDMMTELGYLRAIEDNAVLHPYKGDSENEHDFYVPKCRINDYEAIGLYSSDKSIE